MRYSLITQVLLIGISLVIVFTLIRPMLGEIRDIQDQVFVYSDTVAKASQFNARLQELIQIRDSFSERDMLMLENFMPTTIDTLKVMNDIESIFKSKEIPIISLTAKDVVAPVTDIAIEGDIIIEEAPQEDNYQDYELTFAGSYDQLKEILLLLERNATLLEVIELEFETKQSEEIGTESKVENLEEGMLNFALTLRTYSLALTPL